jgi:drug/metabolite transporter (DMT)-like permease
MRPYAHGGPILNSERNIHAWRANVVGWSLVAAISYTAMAAALRWATTDFDPLAVGFWKALFCVPLVCIGLAWSGQSTSAPSSKAINSGGHIVLIAASFLQGISFILLSYGLTVLPIATVTFLAATRTLLVLILAAFIERTFGDWRKWLAVFMGLTGVALIVQPGVDFGGWQSTSILIAALLTSVAAILITRAAQDAPPVSVLRSLLCGEALFAIFLLIRTSITIEGWRLGVIGAASLGHVVCLFATIRMLQSVGYGSTALLEYIRLPVSVVFGLIVFNEALEWPALLGGAAIFTGLVVGLHKDAPNETSHGRPERKQNAA